MKTAGPRTAPRPRGPLAEPAPFIMPASDDPEFAALPGNVRREVHVWAARIAKLWHVRPVTAAIAQLARSTQGHWRALVNGRKLSSGLRTLAIKMPAGGLRVAIISRTPREVVLQIMPIVRRRVAGQSTTPR
jgi:hypothetical protein